jgi:hypothetical protein
MRVSASMACLTCSNNFEGVFNGKIMKFHPNVDTNLRDACFPAIEGLYILGQDYQFMA